MAELPENTREAILYLLKTRDGSTAKDLAERIGVSATAIRQLLTTLSGDGLVESSSVKQAQGRPTHVYNLTSPGHDLFPDSYRQTAVQMLEAVREIGGEAMVRDVLDRQLEGLEQKYRERLEGLSLDERLAAIDRLRSDEGFMVELEEGVDEGDGQAIVERHCPIYAVAKAFPGLCAAEHSLLERVLNTKLKLTHLMTDGESYCRFAVAEEEEPLSVTQPLGPGE